MVENGEIAHSEQFHLFPQCFLKAVFLQCVKMSIYGGRGLTTYMYLSTLKTTRQESRIF